MRMKLSWRGSHFFQAPPSKRTGRIALEHARNWAFFDGGRFFGQADTVLGASQAGPCVFSMVERKSGYVLLGQLDQRTSAFVNARARQLIRAQDRPVRMITVDNGTEFHDYAHLERTTGTRFYFATPHHAWERGTNENTKGLLRQYLPERQSMAHLTQHKCNRIAAKINRRPRKRLGYRTPEECYKS